MVLNEIYKSIFFSIHIRKKTLATYQSIYKNHICPTLGSIELSEITRAMIKATICNLPAQTSRTTLAVIKMLFREALERGFVEKSPAHGLRGPQVFVRPRKFLTWDEIQDSDFGKYTHHIRFLALHGLRWSEAVALTDSDIRDGKIHITKSIHGDTKSRSGMRIVPLIGEFRQFPRHPRTLRKVLKPHGITIHSLRHTYAYLLKSKGVHVSTAQKLLGHSDPKITLAVYTRVLDSEIDDVGFVLNQMAKNAHSSEMSDSKPAKYRRN